jgi:hypothetical protein
MLDEVDFARQSRRIVAILHPHLRRLSCHFLGSCIAADQPLQRLECFGQTLPRAIEAWWAN